jgi:hypothetical protein
VNLTAERDHMFPPMATKGDPRRTAQEDLLSELIRWNRDESDS